MSSRRGQAGRGGSVSGGTVTAAVITAVGGIIAAVIVSQAGAGGAVDRPPPDACPPRNTCFWPESNYEGQLVTVPPELSDKVCRSLLFTARSAKNSSTQNQWLFSGPNCTGARWKLDHDNGNPQPAIEARSYRHT